MSALVLVLLVLLACPARAQRVVAVLSSELPAYREALSAFEAEMGTTTVLPVARRANFGLETEVVVAFGGRAARKRYPAHAVVVQVLAPGVDLVPHESASRVVAVRTLPEPQALIARARKLKPDLTHLALLWSQSELRRYVGQVSAAGASQGVSVVSTRVRDHQDLPHSLREMPEDVKALWVAPDPSLLDEDTFEIIRSFARAREIQFYVPLEALVTEGADGAIAPKVTALGKAAADAVRRVLAGQVPPAEVYAAELASKVPADEIRRSTASAVSAGRRTR